MRATLIGLHVTTLVFQVHGIDAPGKTVVTKCLRHEDERAFP
ncbi:hypothetical protein [Azospirillum canadense]|nr:hypothetical protein [Azospirillum canadense]MCW2241526.1 hypothetical protein [Azospirillum canadense]